MEREGELEEYERHHLALAATRQDRQELLVVLDRLVECVLLARAVARLREVRDGLLLVGRAEPVMREQPGDLVLVAGVALLEPLGRHAVHPLAVVLDERSVRRLLDQGVLEAVLGLRPAAALAQEVQSLEFGERGADLAVAVGRQCLQQRQAELSAEDRRGHQREVRRGREPVDPRQDHLLDGRRDLDDDVVVEAPAVVLVHQRAGVCERAHELLQEEWVPLGRLQDPSFHLMGKGAGADQGMQELAARVAREGLKRDLARAVREIAGGDLLHAPGRVVALGAHREHQEQGRRLGVGEQPLEQL